MGFLPALSVYFCDQLAQVAEQQGLSVGEHLRTPQVFELQQKLLQKLELLLETLVLYSVAVQTSLPLLARGLMLAKLLGGRGVSRSQALLVRNQSKLVGERRRVEQMELERRRAGPVVDEGGLRAALLRLVELNQQISGFALHYKLEFLLFSISFSATTEYFLQESPAEAARELARRQPVLSSKQALTEAAGIN